MACQGDRSHLGNPNLDDGEHPRITHQSCINYLDSRVLTLDHLTSLLARDIIRLQDKLDPAILERVRCGASKSKRIPWGNLSVPIVQELPDISGRTKK